MTSSVGTLYVCYLGIREPLVHAQVLPYLRELADGGVRVSLLTFEPDLKKRWNRDSIAEWKDRLQRQGIHWHLMAYHRRPTLPATLYDIAAGAWRAAAIARREHIGIFHGRSHVGATIAMLARRLRGGRAIFDIRGLLADEYVESGRWRADGNPAKLVKRAERWLCRSADGIVILTERARETLFGDASARARPIEVIPCCVDLSRFIASTLDRDRVRRELGVSDRLVCVHAGPMGGAYVAAETAAFLAAARAADPRVFALVLTPSEPASIAGELERAGLSTRDYRLLYSPPEDVPRYLAAADVGLALVHPGFARHAASPTKVAEYLASGVPVISTAGVGDLDSWLEQAGVGVLLPRLDRAAFNEAFAAVCVLRHDPDLSERCRREARLHYDLRTVGGPRYRRLYTALSADRPVRVRAFASYPVEAASSRFRLTQYLEPLAARGVDVRFSPFLDSSLYASLYKPTSLAARLPKVVLATTRQLACALGARRAAVVFVQREATLFGPPLAEWIAVRLLRRPLVLDLDDPTYLNPESAVYGRLATMLKDRGKTDRLIRWSHVVTCGSPTVAEHVRSRGARAELLPTIVDTRIFRPGPADRHPASIGWIGTHTTSPFLERLFPLFERLARDCRFRLVVIGSGRDEIRIPGVQVEARAWRMDREADDFRSLDVGVYPLPDDAWSAGKSGLKAVQYMASGVPFVMSPVGVCADIGVPGATHYTAMTDDEWLAALTRLLTDPALRRQMGREGRAFAEDHYSIERHADRLASILRELR
jgi:glycosyltransferase involved in cell wall biosynthesis